MMMSQDEEIGPPEASCISHSEAVELPTARFSGWIRSGEDQSEHSEVDVDAYYEAHMNTMKTHRFVRFSSLDASEKTTKLSDSEDDDDQESQQQQSRDSYEEANKKANGETHDHHDHAIEDENWLLQKVRPVQDVVNDGSHWLVQFATILLSAYLTHSFCHQGEQVHVQIAIMTVIVLFGAIHPQLIAAAGCGAFVGGQSLTAPNYGWLILFTAITGCYWCFVVTKFEILEGFGGRMGTTTFLGMNTSLVVFLCPLGVVSWEQYGTLDQLWSGRLDWIPTVMFVVSIVWLSWAGAACRKYATSNANPILVPVSVALTSMLIVNATNFQYRGHMHTGFAIGSYVAMASFSRLPTLWEFVLVGILAGGWGVLLEPFFLGFGGKAGFTAMLGHVTYEGACRVRRSFQTNQRQQEQ